MSDKQNIIYLYDGSFEGLLTSVFDAFLNHTIPENIEITENGQFSIDAAYYHVATDTEKSNRVADKIIKVSSKKALHQIYYTYLSECPQKEIQIFNYIRACLKFGYNVDRHMTLDCVSAVLYSSQTVGSEAHWYTGFVRFSKLKNDVFYAEIEPKNNVLPAIMPHFVSRYRCMPFMIHDINRMECLVYNGKDCVILPTQALPKLKLSNDEVQYRDMWKTFYDTVEIKERHNEKQRMTMMPKRFWSCMTEFQYTNS